MPNSTLAGLDPATAGTGGLFYGTQSGVDRKFTMTAAGATLVEAADAAAQKTALGLAAVQPFMLAIKNVTVLTTGAGSTVDVATVTLPSWCTRYRLTFSGTSICFAESASGTLAGASFIIRDAASGGGNVMNTTFSGPASTSVVVQVTATSTSAIPATAQTLYLTQTANSANTGVISVYLMVMPLL